MLLQSQISSEFVPLGEMWEMFCVFVFACVFVCVCVAYTRFENSLHIEAVASFGGNE